MERKIGRILLGLYAAAMIFLLLIRQPDPIRSMYWQDALNHTSFIPFRMIRLYFRLLADPERQRLFRWAIVNMVGNVLLFIPLGWLLPTAFEWLQRFYRTLLVSAAAVCVAEVGQMLLLVGTCDIDDLFLNLLGAALGYGVYRLLHGKASV